MILPGETTVVEAIPNPIGLKLSVVYHTNAETKQVLYRRWSVKNDAVIEILSISQNGEIQLNGCKDLNDGCVYIVNYCGL